MKHSEVITALSEQLEISKQEVSNMLEHVSTVFRKLLDNDTSLTLPSLGTFQIVERGERKGYSPLRKQHLILPRKRVLTYHPSSRLKDEAKQKKRMK